MGIFDKIRMLDAEVYPHAFYEIGSVCLDFTKAFLKADSVIADVRITMSDTTDSEAL